MQKIASVYRRGITLVEMMVVVIVIGILVAISYPLYLDHQEEALASKAVNNLYLIRNAQNMFRVDNGNFAGSLANLQSYTNITTDDGDWTYATALTVSQFSATATRSGGRFNGQTIVLEQTGDDATDVELRYAGVVDGGWPP